jgi:hypothetical protein
MKSLVPLKDSCIIGWSGRTIFAASVNQQEAAEYHEHKRTKKQSKPRAARTSNQFK